MQMDGSCVQFKDPLLVVLIKIQPSGDHQQLYCRSVGDPNRSINQQKPLESRHDMFSSILSVCVCFESFKELLNYFISLNCVQSRYSVTWHGAMGPNIF